MYLWDLDDGGFAGVVLFKKGMFLPLAQTEQHLQATWFPTLDTVLAPVSPTESTGSWDSIHVFEASERGRQAHYKLTSTIMLNMVNKREKQANESEKKTSGEIGLSGSMTRQVSLNPSRSPLRPRFRLWVLREGVKQYPPGCRRAWFSYPLTWWSLKAESPKPRPCPERDSQ